MMLLTPAEQEKLGFLAETKVATKIPYSYLVDDETIETKSGHLLQTIKIDGLLAETMDDVLIDHELQIRNTLLMSLADSSTSLYFHTIRKKETCLLNGNYDCEFVEKLQTNWNNVLQQKKFYVNAHYITVVKKPPVGKARQLSDLFNSLSKKFHEETRNHYRRNMLDEINKITHRILTTLSSYGAKKLSVLNTSSKNNSSELLSFLSYLINLADREIVPPNSDLAAYLPYKRSFFDLTTGTMAFRDIQNQSQYAAILSIKNYCGKTSAGLLDVLLDVPAEMIIAQSFSFLDKRYAREKIKEHERNIKQSDDGETRANDAIYSVLDDIGSGGSVTGEHQLSILCHETNTSALEKNIGLVDAALSQIGMIAIREDKGIKPAYYSLLPANHAYIIRRAPISSRNMAAFASLHNYSIGKKSGNHWGDAITILETISGTPYYFNFHVLDVANTF
ncbi:MAG: hypothetical protein JO149_01345, partial [Gammaproteobacteria bacterium]|nr:hypothetical protein [Gammaproteobacteria bacterium]